MVPQTKKLTVDAITHAPTQVVMLPYEGYQRICQMFGMRIPKSMPYINPEAKLSGVYPTAIGNATNM